MFTVNRSVCFLSWWWNLVGISLSLIFRNTQRVISVYIDSVGFVWWSDNFANDFRLFVYLNDRIFSIVIPSLIFESFVIHLALNRVMRRDKVFEFSLESAEYHWLHANPFEVAQFCNAVSAKLWFCPSFFRSCLRVIMFEYSLYLSLSLFLSVHACIYIQLPYRIKWC